MKFDTHVPRQLIVNKVFPAINEITTPPPHTSQSETFVPIRRLHLPMDLCGSSSLAP
jgi:hypothetical protein